MSPHMLQELTGDLVANTSTPGPWLPGPADQGQTCLWTTRSSSPGLGPTPDVLDPPSTGSHSCPSALTWGPAHKGRGGKGMEELAGSGSPTTSLEACPLPQDPRAAKTWPGPSLTLPLLAAPPKEAATNSEAPGSGPEALARAWGREY